MPLPRLKRLLAAFARSRRGNVAVIFVFCLPVVLAAVGGAIDFSGRETAQSKLQDAVDAASVGSVATNSAAFIAAAQMSSDGPIAVGVTGSGSSRKGNISAATSIAADSNPGSTISHDAG